MTTTTRNRDEINDYTGFATGARFESPEEVRAYFTPESQREMLGDDAITDADMLAAWAELVIENRWHMTDAAR